VEIAPASASNAERRVVQFGLRELAKRRSQGFAIAVWLNSHRQNNAELRLTAQHARVRLGRFFERIRFNHGSHAG